MLLVCIGEVLSLYLNHAAFRLLYHHIYDTWLLLMADLFPSSKESAHIILLGDNYCTIHYNSNSISILTVDSKALGH